MIYQLDFSGTKHPTVRVPSLGLAPLNVYAKIKNEMRHGVFVSLHGLTMRYGIEYKRLWRHAQNLEARGLLHCVRAPGLPNVYCTPEVKAKVDMSPFKFNQCVGLRNDPEFMGFVAGALAPQTGYEVQHIMVVIRNGGQTYPKKGVKPIPAANLMPRDEKETSKTALP